MPMILNYLYRLGPGNPILLRVVESGGKRRRDLIIRTAYLGILVAWVVAALITGGGTVGAASLDELAKTSALIFQQMSYLQLALVALLAPIFTAGAITQERDSQTYDILLATPLSNGQIVLGSLLSRLFFVVALLISGIPVFSITQVFGGVAIASIVMSFAIAAATAFVTGALAMAIATLKVGTRRTIFSFYLFIAVYLVGVYLLDGLAYFHPVLPDAAGVSISIERTGTSWFTGVHPFLALRVIFNVKGYAPPDLGSLPESLKSWPWSWYWTRPAGFYISSMFALSLVLVLPSIVLLRRVAQSTISPRTWLLQRLRIVRADRTRKPRGVWNNPVAWREARTKASAARASILRYGFIAIGVGGAVYLAWRFNTLRTDEVDYYITAGSYDPASRQLTVYGKELTRTYLLDSGADVRINGVEVDPRNADALNGRYQISFTSTTPNGTTLNMVTATDIQRGLSDAQVRTFLLGAVTVEFAVILLIVTNAAASTVTREKEDGSLDLLLSTPITSHYYIWGKLRGLVAFVMPLIAVPLISVTVFVASDWFRSIGPNADSNFRWIVFPEALLILPGTLIIVAAFGGILGMQMSLRCRKTVMAVMSSVGIMLGVAATLGWCGNVALRQFGRHTGLFNLILASFSPFTILTVLIDPYSFADAIFVTGPGPGDQAFAGRIVLMVFSWVSTAIYAAIVWAMYRSMVKNFDMTIRRQAR